MRWRLYLGLALVTAGSIAAIVAAIASVSRPNEIDRVKSALRLQTNCPGISVRRPSRAPIVKRWGGLTSQSADIVCADGPHVIYAKFADPAALQGTVAATQPNGGYCLLDGAVLLGRTVGAASTVVGDMCQSLGGHMVIASAD